MKKRLLSLTLILGLLLPVAAACQDDTPPTDPPAQNTPAPQNTEDEAEDPGTTEAPGTEDARTDDTEEPAGTNGTTGPAEPFTFSLYYSYDWWTIYEWGADATSKYWQDTYGVTIDQQKPDADASARLNLMLSSGNLPDAIQMDRNADWIKAARLGTFIDLAPLKANNPTFDELFLESTQDLLKIDDVLYSIPHWARKEPTGGNDVWMVNKKMWEAAGSPELNTFEDLYAYAKYVKDNIPETESGFPTIPFATENNANAYDKITSAFYRSYGGPNKTSNFTARIDGKIQLALRDDLFREAVMEANKWYREGLIYESQFADTNDQVVEKMSTGRTALLYYDFSQDDVNKFRTIMREDDPDNDYIILENPVYPPAGGAETVYPDHKETVGWNTISITKEADEPQRIFDFLTHMLTKEGSIEMMYGPKGGWWDELDDEGNPILKQPENSYTEDERNATGSWRWSFMSHSDNVDMTKFAVNAQAPEDQQSFVIKTQANVLSPIMFMTDEYVNLQGTVDPTSDLGIARQLCNDEYLAVMPRIIMASSEDEANTLYDQLLKFHDDNRFPEVEAAYDELHQATVETQGFTGFEGYIGDGNQ